ncbi:hypothetical protein AAFF_G00092410 [Aldrovandia affinis]|uniref:Uncharacterized protein n=1 Tax=Aldrovandia affinis TaxID=143900 RepID=A0AAD7T2Z8_9TELE|nr:hypothetical protein AAFF_G00092410 [Aldrovandia affinis]
MQEESGEIECSESNGALVWSCPLCQQGQTDRDALARHLTHRHSVLPACLDRLLETAIPADCASEDNVEADTQSDIEASSSQQVHWERSPEKAMSDLSETHLNTEGFKQAADNTRLLRGSRVKVASCREKEIEGEGKRDQEEAEGSLVPTPERTQLPDSLTSVKGSSSTAVDDDRSIEKICAAAPGDSALEKFLDPNCPFKCNACLELFPSKINASASPATPAPQLIPQQQLLLPLFLNGLQAQNQSLNPESASPVLAQPVPVLGLNTAQQALLAQRLSGMQGLGLAVGNSAAAQPPAEEKGKGETDEEEEMTEKRHSTPQRGKKDGEEDSLKNKDKVGERSLAGGSEHGEQTGSKDPACTNANVKPPTPKVAPPNLSEFQSQVLWAFLESRSEADAASPSQEDCESLGLEVGLEVEEVRRWLWEARQAREGEKLRGNERASCKAVPKDPEEDCAERAADMSLEEEEGVLTIVESDGAESPATNSHAMDLSNSSEREQEGESQGSDSEKEEFYTSIIVTDEESLNSSTREEPVSPMRVEAQGELAEKKGVSGGKVLRSSTVFLSDAEDEEDDNEAGAQKRKKKRKREMEKEADGKRERRDPDVDLELDAQADPPAPLSVEQQSLPRISAGNIMHPLSLSLAPFATQFISPYVLQLPASAVGLGINAGDDNRGKVPTFANPPAITRCSGPFPDPLNAPPPASHTPPSRFLSNGGEYESALDLSIRKNHSSTSSLSSSSSSASVNDKILAQRDRLLDGLGLRPTAVGVPSAGGLIVVRVKPESALAIPTTTNSHTVSSISSNNNAKTNALYIRPESE